MYVTYAFTPKNIPFSGRNPLFEKRLKLRPYLLILNKVDLADLRQRNQVAKHLEREGITRVMYTNCKQQIDYVVKKKVCTPSLCKAYIINFINIKPKDTQLMLVSHLCICETAHTTSARNGGKYTQI